MIKVNGKPYRASDAILMTSPRIRNIGSQWDSYLTTCSHIRSFGLHLNPHSPFVHSPGFFGHMKRIEERRHGIYTIGGLPIASREPERGAKQKQSLLSLSSVSAPERSARTDRACLNVTQGIDSTVALVRTRVTCDTKSGGSNIFLYPAAVHMQPPQEIGWLYDPLRGLSWFSPFGYEITPNRGHQQE